MTDMPDLLRPIDCPVPWCTGSFSDHGGLGDAPWDWVHADGRGVEVAPGWWLSRSQIGGGAPTWELWPPESITGSDPEQLAERLTALARAVQNQ
ncbi:hypothetical protein ACWIBQ_03370 [Microbacterium keratanolyticum]